MKKVNMYTPSPNDGIYSVRLGNGYTYEFTSQKKLDKFIVETSKFLTDQMYLTNEIYSDLFASYRRLWGFFHHDKESYRFRIFKEEQEIKASFVSCESILEKLWSKSVNNSTNNLVFYDLKKAVRELINVDLKLKKMILNNPPEAIKLSHLLRSLQLIEHEINSYAVNESSGVHDDLQPIIELKIAN